MPRRTYLSLSSLTFTARSTPAFVRCRKGVFSILCPISVGTRSNWAEIAADSSVSCSPRLSSFFVPLFSFRQYSIPPTQLPRVQFRISMTELCCRKYIIRTSVVFILHGADFDLSGRFGECEIRVFGSSCGIVSIRIVRARAGESTPTHERTNVRSF